MINKINYWTFIESAWETLPKQNEQRKKILKNHNAINANVLEDTSREMVIQLRSYLETLGENVLRTFIHWLEEKLYIIDRKNIHKYIDGSEDFFLYNRGFIVALGEAYYNEVNKDPSCAFMDLDCYEICFVGYEVYEEKFEKFFVRGQYHSIETFSNLRGW